MHILSSLGRWIRQVFKREKPEDTWPEELVRRLLREVDVKGEPMRRRDFGCRERKK